jgi:hypothetical protein
MVLTLSRLCRYAAHCPPNDRRGALPLFGGTEYPKRENKVCIGSFEPDACSAYIVKRRYVWKLPGVLRNS